MKLSIIAALSQNNVIGKNNSLPWHLPADLKRFKTLTLNKAIIMGRKTWDSLGKPLPQRENIVVSRNQNFSAQGCHVTHSLDAAISHANTFSLQNHCDEIMVIGGAEIFAQALPHATNLYFTIIEKDFAGDSFFPEFDCTQWHKTSEESHILLDPDTQHTIFSYRYIDFVKK